jgi:exodeoxyribonuclease VII large subunit
VSSRYGLPFDEPVEPEADGGGPPGAAERARTLLTVSELTARIRGMLEAAWADVWVVGELSNCRVWNTGHVYFTLKDPGAQLRAVMFRSSVRALKFRPEDGLRVIARGRLSVYDPKGEYQLVCSLMEPQGFGALQLAYEQLKRRLQGEGLFDAARKRTLPALPRKIGIVTSLDGAAIRDIIQVLGRRYPNAHLIIRPARVQGEGAAADVARGLADVAAVPGVDVIIVGRGGGSIEDLWAFNEEIVARAIAASPVPVISAVGHETDVTIADLAADVRAPTPSAAAELVVSRKEDFCDRIDRLGERLTGVVLARLARLAVRVHELTRRPGLAGLPARMAVRGRHLGELSRELDEAVRSCLAARRRAHQTLHLRLEARDQRRRLGLVRARLVTVDGALASAMLRRRHRTENELQACAGRLSGLSPLAVLARGYAVCWDESRTRVIREAGGVPVGGRVRVTLHEGELGCRVTDVMKTDN